MSELSVLRVLERDFEDALGPSFLVVVFTGLHTGAEFYRFPTRPVSNRFSWAVFLGLAGVRGRSQPDSTYP